MITANDAALPALESLDIRGCGITVNDRRERKDSAKPSPSFRGFIIKSLVLIDNSRLQSLQLNFCTSLERLEIRWCYSLVALEGLRFLVNLKHLVILKSTAFGSLTTLESYDSVEGIPSHSYELFPALESLEIDYLSLLNTSFCKGLTRLRSLKLFYLRAPRLIDEQERALLLLRSLQELQFQYCFGLVHLPAALRGLISLKRLEINNSRAISGLPKDCLPPSLEELVIQECSDELSEKCRSLPTSKLEVTVDGRYVD
ncbi:probable disease resistance protein At5g66890 [Triticum dicoccoides]|uniref:probable disease resistance protein At5g66890 n=1 Tax=Triticum dicoccoides TaxID=85692 RepID=UPI0018912BBE|nr:probable disease resistance protein At5g66890 [Triticum dicoccoides]